MIAPHRIENAARVAHTDAIVACRRKRRRGGLRLWLLCLAPAAAAVAFVAAAYFLKR